MKKKVITAIIMMGLFFGANAQVGINIPDGTVPKATLEIVGNSGVADGVLIPRITLTNLNNKSAYDGDRNGTLIFVTVAQSEVGTGKAVDIASTGFYYYDGPAGKWKSTSSASSGGSYGSFTPTLVTINLTTGQAIPPSGSGISFTLSNLWSVVAGISGANYFEFTAASNDATGYTIPFPEAALFKDRTIYIRNAGNGTYYFSDTSNMGITGLTNMSAIQLYSKPNSGDNCPCTWYSMGGRR
ncbi:MAG: hypothetical protein LBQ84_07985 [Flavobacteriaceae bacterium]|jgi:hypothetical protein|nr:hypothetical protein [Flavobacteriaceae bacterium]